MNTSSKLVPIIAAGAIGLAASFVSCDDSGETSTSGTGGTALTCGSDSPAAFGACVEQSRYEADLSFVAQVRDPGSAHHRAVRDRCEQRFTELGYTVELHDYGTGVNVIGVKPGASDARILVSAHYDHIPDCVGADDNATGVAAVLESARALSQGQFEKTLVMACWDEEELGLVGADAYAQRSTTNGENIEAVFVYEMLGYVSDVPNTQNLPIGFDAVWPEETADVVANESRGDFIAAIGDESLRTGLDLMKKYGEMFETRTITLEVAATLKNDPAFRDLQRSDHAPFWRIDTPALFITDTSEFRYEAYHCRNGMEDVLENLDNGFSTGVVKMTTAAVAEMLGVQ